MRKALLPKKLLQRCSKGQCRLVEIIYTVQNLQSRTFLPPMPTCTLLILDPDCKSYEQHSTWLTCLARQVSNSFITNSLIMAKKSARPIDLRFYYIIWLISCSLLSYLFNGEWCSCTIFHPSVVLTNSKVIWSFTTIRSSPNFS